MTIFSAAARTNPSPRSYGESHFQFLDRVSGPYWDQVRDLIEAWFSRLGLDAQPDVRGRLRSRDDRQTNGAFFELYLHECLLRMGYSVTCHPEVEGTSRRPDFLAKREGNLVYLEARSASSSDVAVGDAARVNAVYDSLDKLDSPNFFLWMELERRGAAPLRARPLRSCLERWLAGLDPDDHALDGNHRDDLPGLAYEDAGWRIDFRALPKSLEARGRGGARPLGILEDSQDVRVQDEEGIRGALSDKGSAYGALNAPFVVAVASSSLSPREDDVLNALYGTEVLQRRTFPDGSQPTAWGRPDGYWNRGGRLRHRGVSAVLVVKNLHAARVGIQQHTLWAHPDPELPVERLPIWRRSVIDNGSLTTVDPDCSQAEWFGLGDPWPVGEPFPR